MSHPFPFRQMGDFQITALNDGNMSASLDLLSGIKKADAEVIQYRAGLDEPDDILIFSQRTRLSLYYSTSTPPRLRKQGRK
ncbi:hypothetical protein [Tatumella ptyseos]|uniref:hypothetical protein n=1 Tax=Tatumella ptyseos TaxID=82987 RepID=UPI0023F1602D|nr:hypothetical protein [Tatumella ptyseos]